MKLIPVFYYGFTGMDRRFSSPMLPWIVSEIRKRDFCEKISVGVEDGILQAYNPDFELQFSHRVSQMTRFSQADLDPTTFLYLLRDDTDQILYCYLFQAKKSSDMLHVLDEVLDPFIRNTTIEPTAYQLMATPHHWRLTENLEMFFEKVTDSGVETIFQDEGSHTFFIPIDRNIDDHRYNHLDNYTIQSHIVPNQVIFTRPANKVFFYETACNGDYIYVLASFVERGDKMFAKSTTVLSDSDHPKGEVLAEIVTPNIPVKNGVVHIISRPLVIFDRELRPFPYLSVYYKVSSDPFLEFSYDIGENTGVNYVLNHSPSDKKITYFVPRNQAWKRSFEDRSFTVDEQRRILSRHIVVDSTALSMERLLYLSKTSYNGSFLLSTVGGEEIMLNVLFLSDSYFINFNDTFIRVYRANYECEDGIVHVLESFPFLYQEEMQPVGYSPVETNTEDAVTPEINRSAAEDFYSYLKQMFT